MYSKKIVIGYILVIVGIMIPLQAFTNICYRDMTSSSGYEQYKKEYREQEKKYTSKRVTDYRNEETKSMEEYNSSVVDGSGLVDPFVADDYKSGYNIKGWDQDEVFAYLIIPAINVKKPIRLDASYDHLDKGVAHVYGTSLPIGGINRRSVIAGHRGWYRDIMFLNLGKLRPGDLVYIDRGGKTLEYKVKNNEIISPSQWQKLKPVDGKDMLTLLSCHPIRPPSAYRLLVNCERVDKKRNPRGGKTSKYISNVVDSHKRPTPLNSVFYVVAILGWIVVFVCVCRLIRIIRRRVKNDE